MGRGTKCTTGFMAGDATVCMPTSMASKQRSMLWLVVARGWRMSHVIDDFMGEGYAVDGPSIQRLELLVREEVAVHEKGKSIQNEISLPE